MFKNLKNSIKYYLTRRKLNSTERLYFENDLILIFGANSTKKVLFVGIALFTHHYPNLFSKFAIEFYSIYTRPEASLWTKYPYNHKTLDVTSNISQYFVLNLI